MSLMPFQIVGVWLRGLFALLLLGGAGYLLYEWNEHRVVQIVEKRIVVPQPTEAQAGEPDLAEELRPIARDEVIVRTATWEFGWNKETGYLIGGLILLGWALGGWGVAWLFRSLFRSPLQAVALDVPSSKPIGRVERLRRPDGTELHIETCGPVDAPVLVMTHGWTLDANEWCYARKELARHFRLILWDLPGLGRSTRPANDDYSLEKMAHDLQAVLTLAGNQPVVLVGHSIGGMIILTWSRLFLETQGAQVRGLVLGQSTYTNPVKTSGHPLLYSILQKPLLEPLCHLMIWLSPVFRFLNFLSYLNGSAHRSTNRMSFSGRESWAQLEFLTRYWLKASPAVVGHGFLGMFRYDATEVLSRIRVPALVVAGDRDSSCRPEASQFMAQAIPTAQLAVLQAAQHAGLFEHHEQFHTAVREFASSCFLTSQETPAPDLVVATGQALVRS